MHFASMSLGILDFLIEWLSSFLIWIIGWVMDLIMVLFSHLFYLVASHLLEICDICQMIFKKLCGMGTFWYNHGGVNDGAGFNAGATLGKEYKFVDPLVTLFTNKTVGQVLLTLSLVSIVMVIVAAIIKIIQSEFSTEGSKNSKAGIFGQALKCLVLFFAVPICCVGGVIASNALLRTIDQATSLAAEGSTMGSQILVSAAAQQNIVRQGGNLSAEDWQNLGLSSQPTITDSNREQYALVIDTAFRSNSVKVFSANSFWGYQDVATVEKYYDVVGMNFVTLIGGALLAAYTMLMASFGMVMRLFKATILYMISPPMIALMPLDGGSALKSWRKDFLGQILAAYGTVVSLNLLFILLPVVNNINLFGNSDFPGVDGAGADGHIASVFNSFCHLIFTLTALFTLKDVSGMISSMIGADDAAKSGSAVAAKVGGTAMAIAGGVGGVAAKGLGAIAGGIAKKNPNSKVGKAFGAIGNSLGKVGTKGTQKLKGTLGKMYNDTFGAVTGTSMSTETDPEKALAAKEEKKKKREERIKSGTAGIMDWAGHGVDNLTDPEKAKKATGAEGFFRKAISGTNTVLDTYSQGGTNLIREVGENAMKTEAHKEARTKVEEQITAENAALNVKNGTVDAQIGNILTALGAGNVFEGQQGIEQLLNALNSIADKTETQKDLILKLTTMKEGIAGANGNVGKIKAMVKSGGADTAFAADMRAAGATAATESTEIHKIATSTTFNVQAIAEMTDKADIAAEIARQAHALSTAGGGTVTLPQPEIEKIITRLVKAQKTQLEQLQSENK